MILLNGKEAASFCGFSYKRFKALVDSGEGPNFAFFGKQRLFRQEDLVLWIERKFLEGRREAKA